MQSEAIGLAYRVWRRKWRGDGHEEVSDSYFMSGQALTALQTSGVLVWQLNDCWPATSWAIADYYVGIAYGVGS